MITRLRTSSSALTMTTRTSTSSLVAIAAALLLCLIHTIDAFQLSMVASSQSPPVTFRPPQTSSSRPRVTTATRKSTPQQSITSGLISNLAVAALKLRLRDNHSVKCDVTGSSSDLLLNGRVGPVTVKGRGWKSQLGLTCRAIEATVDTCDLDMGRILSHQKLVLNTPAKGSAMVALDADDFGSFITHPLMKPPGLMSGNTSSDAGMQFQRHGVEMDVNNGKVTFYGSYLGETWKCSLQRGCEQKRALVEVVPHSSQEEEVHSLSPELTNVVSDFFNEMVFELDGTFLTFRDMMLTDKGGSPSVMLALGITVRKFPSPGLAF